MTNMRNVRSIRFRETDFRPATPIELAMLDAVGKIRGSLSPNRYRFVTDMRHQAADQEFPVITDKQAGFLARIVWRYRRRLAPELVLAAALKGGTEKSPFQLRAIELAERERIRMMAVEDAQQMELF